MRRVTEFLIGVVFTMAFFIVPMGVAGTIETHYYRTAEVVAISGDEITVTDTTDNEWLFYGDGYTEGDKVKMLMFTNYTDNTIYDDEIVKVKIVK